MEGSKRLAAVGLGVALIAAAAPASADAAAYRHYVACGLSEKAKPSHRCAKRYRKGAFFRSNRGRQCRNDRGAPILCVYYTVCVKFPTKKRLCAPKQQAEKGTLYVNKITSNIPGPHEVAWFVRGKRVGVFRFFVPRKAGKKRKQQNRRGK
jgi:hypothetical protein